MLALQAVTAEALCARLPGLEPEHARKLLSTVHREHELSPRPGLPRAAIDRVRENAGQPALSLAGEQASGDGFHKYLFDVEPGRIETVRIPLDRPGRYSVCVSSQVGCALSCAFCATGRLGLARNLETWEIVEQVREVRRGLPDGARVHGVVFQGMGEALANADRVLAAIDVLTAPYAQAIDGRAVTVCTAGVPEGIRRLARSAPRVRLALSIGSARPAVRETIMPITRAHSLASVLVAAAEHALTTRLAPMWAITLLAGVNDGDDEARALAALVRDFADRTGLTPRLTVLDYNPIDVAGRDPFARSSRMDAFRDALAAAGVHSHRRYSGGAAIAAACGQLAGA